MYIILHAVAQLLGLKGHLVDVALYTVRQDLQVLHRMAVSFTVSPVAELMKIFIILIAFTFASPGTE